MRTLRLAAALGICGAAPALGASSATLMGVDIYGTHRVADEDVERLFGEKIQLLVQRKNQVKALAEKGGARAAQAKAAAVELVQEIEEGARKTWDFAWVRLDWQEYYTGDSPTVYITIDVVEKKDLQGRMPFRKAPSRSLRDPEGLLAAWNEYAELGTSLARAGQISTGRADCRAFHCQWGSLTPELKRYEDKFSTQVPIHKDALAKVMTDDKDPGRRAAAVNLLAYCGNGGELARLLTEALLDPESQVRDAALEAYSDLAVYHKDVPLPAEQLVAMLDYPTVEDRNKALAVIAALAANPEYRRFLIDRASELLLKLLHLKQPSNHDYAYSVLGLVTKENIGRRDYESWRIWFNKNRSKGQAPAAPLSPGPAPL